MSEILDVHGAIMLARAGVLADGEVVELEGGAAGYAYCVGPLRTLIVRPAGPYPADVQHAGPRRLGGEVVGQREPRERRTRKRAA